MSSSSRAAQMQSDGPPPLAASSCGREGSTRDEHERRNEAPEKVSGDRRVDQERREVSKEHCKRQKSDKAPGAPTALEGSSEEIEADQREEEVCPALGIRKHAGGQKSPWLLQSTIEDTRERRKHDLAATHPGEQKCVRNAGHRNRHEHGPQGAARFRKGDRERLRAVHAGFYSSASARASVPAISFPPNATQLARIGGQPAENPAPRYFVGAHVRVPLDGRPEAAARGW